MKKLNLLLALVLLGGASNLFAQADTKEVVAMIKKNLVDSKEKMKLYEWVETTTVFRKG